MRCRPPSSGFLATGNNGTGAVVFSSADGRRWDDISSLAEISGTYVGTPVAGNTSTVVVINANPKSHQPLAMYRRGDTWYPSHIDPGHLPDAGVVPSYARSINAVVNWHQEFLAVGNVNGESPPAGMV